ncbi:thioredoxin family protein [Sulfurimonas sp. HSL-3221]|uniref:thioredoxin family protein n=1 Tax=Sulfurimonadaceae TaxID=2771471 RepID=UPI001E481138|nr:thioredoxin family protein [Sulfurimonas sp. HSL-3221]UFS62917.1 thioredoxin family protein [Sulfurimonas sp. HSL-3221]
MQTLTEIENILREKPAVMLYFSAPTCNVCHALKPKLVDAIETNFDAVEIVSIDISESPEIASHYSVFAIPTLLVFLDGREFLRKSRHMSVGEVVEAIRRPYEIMFS